MSNYSLIIVWFVIMIPFTTMGIVGKPIRIGNTYSIRWSWFWAILAFAPIFYFAVFTAPRSDTVLYLEIFTKQIPIDWNDLVKEMSVKKSAYGFLLLEWLIKNIFGSKEIAFRLIIGLIHCIPVIYVFRKYSEDYLTTLFLFVANGCHFAWLMNGLRQFMAVSLILLATPFIIKKNYVYAILMILLASTVHTSALIMLPMIFIVQGKPWNWRTLIFIMSSIGLMYYFSKNLGSIDVLLEKTEYAGAMASVAEMGDDGMNPIRALVNSVPAIVSLFARRYLRYENDEVLSVFVNMSIVTAGISMIAVVTSGIMIGRLVIYTSLYSYMLLPAIINHLFTKKSASIINCMMVVFFLLYYWYAYHGY